MHNFVYLAQRRSQEFSCELNFGGRGRAPPLGCVNAGSLDSRVAGSHNVTQFHIWSTHPGAIEYRLATVVSQMLVSAVVTYISRNITLNLR